jgi:hypothetical protein
MIEMDKNVLNINKIRIAKFNSFILSLISFLKNRTNKIKSTKSNESDILTLNDPIRIKKTGPSINEKGKRDKA